MKKYSILDEGEGNRSFWLAGEMIRRYLSHGVAQQSAAMAYYLLFAIFPVLIFVSALLGVLQLDLQRVMAALAGILPRAVVELCGMYLSYVSETSGGALLWFSLVFSVWFPARAANCLMRCVRRAYGLGRPARPIRYRLKMLLYTGFLFAAMFAALVLMVMGRQMLRWLVGDRLLGWEALRLWNGLRFAILTALLFAVLGLLYAVSQDKRQPGRYVLPGAICAAGAWLLLSMGFSFYVENFANYSVIYGTLGAVIVLLIWLFLSAATLILGAELNGALQTLDQGIRKNREAKRN